MTKKRIIITGGAGMIGSDLCEKLHSEGNVVFCIDNFYTGKKENIQHLIDKPYFYLLEHDVCNPLPNINLYGTIDQVYSLASPASPDAYQKDPIFTWKTNVLGSLNCLEFATKHNATILLASTSEIYGDPEIHPQDENYNGNVNTSSARANYDESKRASETIFYDYNRSRGLNTKIVRIFNTFSPRINPNDGRVISNFIFQALKNQPITIYGTGNQTRSFCYIDDTINGLVSMMDAHSAFIGPVNIGNPNEITINELAQQIIQLTNSKSEIIYCPLPQSDPTRRKPCTYLAKSVLGWEAKISLKEGLEKTIEYFKKNL